jgi:capsular exopolysaccharide synthesis family protein
MDSDKLAPRTVPGGLEQPGPYVPAPYVPRSYVPAAPQEPGFGDYWRILLKRRWTVLSAVVIVVTLVAIASFRMAPVYEAVGRIAIYPESNLLNFKDSNSASSEDWDYTVSLDTQVKILQSDSLALETIRKLQLSQASSDPAQGSGGMPVVAPALDSARETEMLGSFHGGLRIATLPNTRMIEIRYTSTDPKRAATVVNALAETYIEENFKTKYQSTMQASEWLSSQLADLQRKVETSQEKLVQYQKENDILGIDEKQNIITQKLDELNKEVTEAEADRIQKQSSYQLTQTGNPELVRRDNPESLIEKLRAQEADLKSQLALLSTQFGPAYPKVAEVTNQLKQVQEAIETEIKKNSGRIEHEYLNASSREKMLRAALEAQKREANKLNERAIQYNLLKRDLDSNRQLYEGLQQKLKEASISAGLKSSNTRIVDAARVPTAPVAPNIPRNLALALLVGLTAGVGLAFLMETLDNTVRTPEQAQLVSALPPLGIIPLSAQLNTKAGNGRPRLSLSASAGTPTGAEHLESVAHSRPRSEIAESYRALRTSILLSSLGAPPKVILVTSALPEEGKTTTAINSAIVLAQKGTRVLLVDADLRRSGVHQALGIRPRGGLSTVLTGDDKLENVIVPWPPMPNLSVLPAGPPPPSPSELLGSAVMKSLLAQWREQYDHIVIDTPPALSVTDPVLLSVEADAVVLVIRSGQTTKESLRRARDLLVQVNAKVMGVVVNALDLRSPDLNYYYCGSKYGGRYYNESVSHKSS